MKNKIKDLFDVVKYKRKFNKLQNNYTSILENKLKDKEMIIELQNNIIAAKEKNEILEKQLDTYKKKYGIMDDKSSNASNSRKKESE